jgi:hypothetical protein
MDDDLKKALQKAFIFKKGILWLNLRMSKKHTQMVM